MTTALPFTQLKQDGMLRVQSALKQVADRRHTRPEWSNDNLYNLESVIQDALSKPLLKATIQTLYGPETKLSDIPEDALRAICLNLKTLIQAMVSEYVQEAAHG